MVRSPTHAYFFCNFLVSLPSTFSAGVTSFGDPCGTQAAPGVYANMDRLLGFISANLQAGEAISRLQVVAGAKGKPLTCPSGFTRVPQNLQVLKSALQRDGDRKSIGTRQSADLIDDLTRDDSARVQRQKAIFETQETKRRCRCQLLPILHSPQTQTNKDSQDPNIQTKTIS